MRIFVTGATGFVGSAVVAELIGAGHAVVGLARSEAGAATLAAAGAGVHRGDLDDPEEVARGAENADAVIHTAFNHDFSRFAESCEADRRLVMRLGEALAGSGRPLVVTSGLGILRKAGTLDETDRPVAGTHPRVASEEAADAVAERGGTVAVVRLPPSVHGVGDHGFVPILIRIAREKGISAWPGDGANRWPAVHRLDAARLYRLVVESGLPGRYHAVAEEGIPFRDIAGVIGQRLGLPATGLAPGDVAAHFGWFSHFVAMSVPASSRATRETLGWAPDGPGLLADLDEPAYFAA